MNDPDQLDQTGKPPSARQATASGCVSRYRRSSSFDRASAAADHLRQHRQPVQEQAAGDERRAGEQDAGRELSFVPGCGVAARNALQPSRDRQRSVAPQ